MRGTRYFSLTRFTLRYLPGLERELTKPTPTSEPISTGLASPCKQSWKRASGPGLGPAVSLGEHSHPAPKVALTWLRENSAVPLPILFFQEDLHVPVL